MVSVVLIMCVDGAIVSFVALLQKHIFTYCCFEYDEKKIKNGVSFNSSF